MTNKTVIKTTIFPAAKKEVFERLKQLKTLQYIAAPYATFTPENNNDDLIWEENAVFFFWFKLFGFLPFGIHTVKVISFSEDGGILPMSKIPMCLSGIIGSFLKKLIKTLHSIRMRWKLERDGKPHLYVCGRRPFIPTGKENGGNF